MKNSKANKYRLRQLLVRPVPDADYYGVANALIGKSIRYCLCDFFIIDVLSVPNLENKVDSLVENLLNATTRNLDVRMIIGGSKSNLPIFNACCTAFNRINGLDIKVKLNSLIQGSQNNHKKLLLCDDKVLIGSHNWSNPSFENETQDSVLIQSWELSLFLKAKFDSDWKDL